MPYDVKFQLPDGSCGFMRMAGRRPARCIECGAESTRLCDWKLAPPKPGKLRAVTCDAALCDTCTHSPAPDKDLCPVHAATWKERNR